jgi:trimeric autotransporter adhesin
MADVLNQMRTGADKSSAFADAIKQLKAKGVNGTTIKQIAEAGIDGGGLETATALLGASGSEIETLNQLQKQINTSAKDAGKTTADIMYGAGIKAAEGLVRGLTKKKKDIENAMMIIAKAMEKSIKKALKIKSPSKVMQDVGHFTAEGFALGVKRNQHIDHAWESMLTTRPTSTTSSVSGASRSGEQYVIPIYIGNRQIDEIWLDTGRRVIRTRGGDVQNILGRR